MPDVDDCSSLHLRRAPAKDYKEVLEKLKAFPIIHEKKDGVHRFAYWDGQSQTCDGNTAHYLEQIIKATISLYGDEWI